MRPELQIILVVYELRGVSAVRPADGPGWPPLPAQQLRAGDGDDRPRRRRRSGGARDRRHRGRGAAALELATAKLLESDKPWSAERLPLVEDRVRHRLRPLAARLGDAEWLDGGFSAGDLMMVSVLLRLRSSGLLDELPNLAAYVGRGEARPAYRRAFDAQLAINAGMS